MIIYRLIAPPWLLQTKPNTRSVLEGQFTDEQLSKYNKLGYNIYYLPNGPSTYTEGTTVDGSMVDTFNFCFVDCDLKDKKYSSKEDFYNKIAEIAIEPTSIVDSGNGVHVYWNIKDLDGISFLRFQRRLIQLFKTDESVATLYQLMRKPGYYNTKVQNNFLLCEEVYNSATSYTSEDFDKLLPPISLEDEDYCQNHYKMTHNPEEMLANINDTLPAKFGKLIKENSEVKALFAAQTDDRSKADFRLASILMLNEFSKEDAMSVLVNTAKASQRAPKHRFTYAKNIIDKIFTDKEDGKKEPLSRSVLDLLKTSDETSLKGQRIIGHSYIDNTAQGFRLGHVLGLVAGVGVGKTAISMNLFHGFVKNNPTFIHAFVSLEQPAKEIAERWAQLCQGNTVLHSKVHIISNYNEDGTYRHLSLSEIEEYIVQYEKDNDVKFGCIVIDHLGVLKKKSKNGENEGLIEVCQSLKSFAVRTNTFLIMQSQSNREKAGIGDLELNKDAAYGTQAFESFLDFLLVCWQPLKRQYHVEGCPTITAFKFAKIRFKNKDLDKVQEDVRYLLYFDTKTGLLRPTTQIEDRAFDFYNKICCNLRKQDRKTEVVSYVSVRFEVSQKDTSTDSFRTAVRETDRH